MGLAACGSDDELSSDDVSTAVTDAVTDVSNAADEAVSDVSNAIDDATTDTGDNADEGQAMDLGNQVVASLQAMPSAGEPMMTSIQEATNIVTAPNQVTGLEDGDNDGMDDDAKFTIETNGGDDKACVQSQNGTWEVTDDEC